MMMMMMMMMMLSYTFQAICWRGITRRLLLGDYKTLAPTGTVASPTLFRSAVVICCVTPMTRTHPPSPQEAAAAAG